MKITQKDVEYVSKLARLHISDKQKEKLTEDMAAIITFADKLSEIDTADIKPAAHAIPVNNVFREDTVRKSIDREALLSNAPEKEAGCFSVPKIVE